VHNSNFIKEGVEYLILSSLVNWHGKNLSIKESLHKSLKFLKFLENFRLVF